MSSTHSLRATVQSVSMAAVAVGGLLGVTLALSGPASATTPATTRATSSATTTATAARSVERSATVRIGHLSPDMPGVDVYLTSYTGRSSVFVTDATYGQVSSYHQVRPGTYTFAIRRHGAEASSAPLKSWSVDTRAGYAYTAAVIGVGSGHRGVVLHDDLTPPVKGHANVRLIQASSRAGTADVDATHGSVIARNAAFGSSTGYASIPAGTWPLQATGDGTTADARVSVSPGTVTSLVLLDAPGGRTRLTSVVDAAGAPAHTAPKGSVDAGAGGTAQHVVDRVDTARPLAALSGGAAVLMISGAALVRRRRAARAANGA